VGEGGTSGPRAGCGKTARTVDERGVETGPALRLRAHPTTTPTHVRALQFAHGSRLAEPTAVGFGGGFSTRPRKCVERPYGGPSSRDDSNREPSHESGTEASAPARGAGEPRGTECCPRYAPPLVRVSTGWSSGRKFAAAPIRMKALAGVTPFGETRKAQRSTFPGEARRHGWPQSKGRRRTVPGGSRLCRPSSGRAVQKPH